VAKRKDIDPIMLAVRELAPKLVQNIVDKWPGVNVHGLPDGGYAMARGVVIELAYAEIAKARGGFVTPVDRGAPDMQPACDEARQRLQALRLAEMAPEHFGHIDETLIGYTINSGKVVANDGRRKSGAHYTPPSMAMQVVERTLEPLLKTIGSQSPLVLKVCDPAVGAGAFLLAVMRMLAPMVVERGEAKTLDEAKRLVAIHCCHGVDKSRYAVHTTKLAMTLEASGWKMPRNWLDDNVKHGDALVGLDAQQIKAFAWKRDQPAVPEIDRLYDRVIGQAVVERQARITALAQLASD
jgi:hypothetical protein